MLIVCLTLGSFTSVADENPSFAARTATLIQNYISPSAEAGSIPVPAVSVAVGHNGNLLYADGFGEARAGKAATAKTVYMVGSITKQFSAAAIFRLIENGALLKGKREKLDITTPIAVILDGAEEWQLKGGPAITVGNLLSMTSNLPNFTRRPPNDLDPWGAVPARRLLTGIKEYRPSEYPGSFEYSNTSYFLLSEVMEHVEVKGRSRSYREIMKDEVFSRLGLKQTGFADEPNIARDLASPHYRRRPRFFQPDWLQGSGDVASTVLDVFKWDAALMQGTALKPEKREIMLSDTARVDPWTYYGAGWFITHKDGIERYFHSGTVSGYTSYNLIVRPAKDEWVSVSLLTNTDGITDLDSLADQIASMALSR